MTDPSSHRVLQDNPNDLRQVGTVETPGIRFYVAALRPAGPPGGVLPLKGDLADRLPEESGRVDDFSIYTWPGWEQPTCRIEKKEAWPIVKRTFESIPGRTGTP